MLGIIRMRRFHIAFRITLVVLLVLVFVVGWIAASICRPTREEDMRQVAAAMMGFYKQPGPHWNEDLPSSLTGRGRQYYRFEPSCDVQQNYMCVEYYYRRFGIEYEPRFTLYRGTTMYGGTTNGPIWTLEPGITFWNPWKQEHYYLREHSITITNTP